MSPRPRSAKPLPYDRKHPEPLLSQRAALILSLAAIIAAAAAALTLWAGGNLPTALLTAGSAFGGTIGLLHQTIGR